MITVNKYEYDDTGTRVRQTVTADGTTTVTEYLYDPQNHTGFTQILEETVDGVLPKAYTLGSDVISQATATQVLHLIFANAGIASVTSIITDTIDAVSKGQRLDLSDTILNGIKTFVTALALNPTSFGFLAEHGVTAPLILRVNEPEALRVLRG